MKSLWKKLEDLSHTTRGIARGGAFLLLLGTSLSGLGTLWMPSAYEDSEEEPLPSILLTHYYHVLLSDEVPLSPPPPLPEEIRWVFQGDRQTWLPRLTLEADSPSPEEGICFARGLWHWHEEEYEEAVRLLRRENQYFPHPLVREITLTVALTSGNPELLDHLTSDTGFEEALSPRFELSRGITSENWPLILRNFIPAQFGNWTLFPLSLTLLAGLIWSILLFSLTLIRPTLRMILLGAVAILLGGLSTWPTVLSSIWMTFEFGWTEGETFFDTLFYMLVSVGLREEVLKLLFFSPFLIRTVKPGRDLEALLLGAMVGLGFAIEENINYFAGYGGGIAVSRFVSANMLHFFLTGVTSLALTRAVREPRKWGMDALQVLMFAIGLHGIYNTILSQPVPGIGDMSYFSGAVLIGCGALFFRELEFLAPPRSTRGITRTAILCWGFCGLVCLELAWAATELPFDQAVYQVGQAALAAVFTGYIFVHYLREPIR
jgi:RsiW-degrading membrane proteinase PrsW (M82 family)